MKFLRILFTKFSGTSILVLYYTEWVKILNINFNACVLQCSVQSLRPLNSEGSLLWHWDYVYNGHLRGPVTLQPIAERVTGQLSLLCTCFYNLILSRLGIEHPTLSLRVERSNWLRHHSGLKLSYILLMGNWSSSVCILFISDQICYFLNKVKKIIGLADYCKCITFGDVFFLAPLAVVSIRQIKYIAKCPLKKA